MVDDASCEGLPRTPTGINNVASNEFIQCPRPTLYSNINLLLLLIFSFPSAGKSPVYKFMQGLPLPGWVSPYPRWSLNEPESKAPLSVPQSLHSNLAEQAPLCHAPQEELITAAC